MKRLLQEAEKLTGIKYDINNFSDVIEAIHAIQEEMGITGTTAKEAASTIEGSLSMTKSAWTNLLTGMADDNANFDTLIDNLVNSLDALGQNLLPRIEIAIKGVGQLIEKLLPPIIARLPQLITDVLPGLLNAGIQMVGSLGNGIMQALPTLISSALQILTTLGQGIAQNLPTLVPTIVNLIISISDTIIANLPMLISVAIDIILALVQGLVTALPTLISEVPRIINSFCDALFGSFPQIIMAGIQIIGMLIVGIIQSIPTLIANIPQIVMAIVNVVTLYNWSGLGKNLIDWMKNGMDSMKDNIGGVAKNIAQWVETCITNIFKGGLNWGKNLISSMGQGFRSMISFLGNSARSVATNALNVIKTKFSEGFNIGKNLIEGIWNGIKNMKDWILSKIGGFAGTIISGIKGFFDIHSPSRIMRDLIGVNIVKGIGVGIDIETPNLQKNVDSNMSDLVAKMKSSVHFETTMTTARVINHEDIVSKYTLDNNHDIDNDEKIIEVLTSIKSSINKLDPKIFLDGKELIYSTINIIKDELEAFESRNPRFTY